LVLLSDRGDILRVFLILEKTVAIFPVQEKHEAHVLETREALHTDVFAACQTVHCKDRLIMRGEGTDRAKIPALRRFTQPQNVVRRAHQLQTVWLTSQLGLQSLNTLFGSFDLLSERIMVHCSVVELLIQMINLCRPGVAVKIFSAIRILSVYWQNITFLFANEDGKPHILVGDCAFLADPHSTLLTMHRGDSLLGSWITAEDTDILFHVCVAGLSSHHNMA
jgi:hypothetical protein